jgi:hypothetical protein
MNLRVDFAEPADDVHIRRLVGAQAMPGRVRIAFCREPDFSLGCAVTGDNPRILVARSDGEAPIVGVACRSERDVFLNGREARIGYLGQLRVDDAFRGRWLVSRGFAALARLDRERPLEAYLASIVEGNEEAAGVLVHRRRPGYPAFREVARYRTLAIPTWGGKSGTPGSAAIGPASPDDIPRLAAFLRTEGARRQLFSVWTERRIRALAEAGLAAGDILAARRNGTIVGTMALWDQSAYKQSVVRGYSGWLKVLSPVLPRPGSEVRAAYASLICIANDDVEVFSRLLRAVCNLAHARRLDYLLVGLDARDPLLRIASRYRRFTYPSRLYLASWDNGGHGHEPLDGRPAYVDIATL